MEEIISEVGDFQGMLHFVLGAFLVYNSKIKQNVLTLYLGVGGSQPQIILLQLTKKLLLKLGISACLKITDP